MVVWGFRGKAQPPPPPKRTPDCCLHHSYSLGSSRSLQLDVAVPHALPFWQVMPRGDSLPAMTLVWDVVSAAGGWGSGYSCGMGEMERAVETGVCMGFSLGARSNGL